MRGCLYLFFEHIFLLTAATNNLNYVPTFALIVIANDKVIFGQKEYALTAHDRLESAFMPLLFLL